MYSTCRIPSVNGTSTTPAPWSVPPATLNKNWREWVMPSRARLSVSHPPENSAPSRTGRHIISSPSREGPPPAQNVHRRRALRYQSRHGQLARPGPARPSRTGTPGANDNASGVAALLETARALAATSTLHDVCLVAYANEEPPFYQTPAMGSAVHAKSVSHHPGRKKSSA